MPLPELLIYSIGMIVGLIPPFMWGKVGGDESLIAAHKRLSKMLKAIHHWQIGLVIIFLGLLLPYPFSILIYGWGVSTTIDDLLFHSFENYFSRKGGC